MLLNCFLLLFILEKDFCQGMTAEFLHHNVLNPAELPVDITGGSVGMSVTGVSLVAEAFVEEKIVFHRQQDVEDCKLVEIGQKGSILRKGREEFR